MNKFCNNSMYIFLTITLIAFFSCNFNNASKSVTDNDGKDTTAAETISDGHNSQNSIDWAGTYRGTLPCADCEGIETAITLNQDGTYQKSETYLTNREGKKNFEENGKFSWDTTGSIVTLHADSGDFMCKVGEGKLFALDMEGKMVEGQLADKYILVKE